MIAQLDKSYYFANSLRRRRSTYPFLTKNIDKWFLESYKKLIICVDFYGIYSVFHPFNFFQKKLNNIHDAHVLIFIRIFM